MGAGIQLSEEKKRARDRLAPHLSFSRDGIILSRILADKARRHLPFNHYHVGHPHHLPPPKQGLHLIIYQPDRRESKSRIYGI
jgi:hypothetical protein